MTRASQAVLLLYALAFVALAAKAGLALTVYHHGEAALLYALALVVAVAACREVGRTHIERPKDKPPGAGLWRRMVSARRARTTFRREACTCNLWFESLGRDHDDWCTNTDTFWRAI